jgi:hypothetical protein
VSEWSAPLSPHVEAALGSSCLYRPRHPTSPKRSEAHAVEPNLNFSPEAIARVDALEFEKLKSVRRRTWVSERKAKEDEVFHAKRAELLAGRLSVAPPVPSKLADFDERGGVSAGADADDTECPPSEPAQLDESDEKTIRSWLLYTEARRAEATARTQAGEGARAGAAGVVASQAWRRSRRDGTGDGCQDQTGQDRHREHAAARGAHDHEATRYAPAVLAASARLALYLLSAIEIRPCG